MTCGRRSAPILSRLVGQQEDLREHLRSSVRIALGGLGLRSSPRGFDSRRLNTPIGIGEDRRSRSFPSHTTRHAGPHLAVR